MNNLDIILLLVIFIPGIWNGFRKGFIYQVVTLVSLVLGTFLSYRFSSALLNALGPEFLPAVSQTMKNVLAFVLIFIAVYIVLYLAGTLIKNISKALVGGFFDKFLGIVLSVAKFALTVGLAIMFFNGLNAKFGFCDSSIIDESKVYGILLDATDKIFPYIKSFITSFKIS